jgi:hypothetical protein
MRSLPGTAEAYAATLYRGGYEYLQANLLGRQEGRLPEVGSDLGGR